MKPMRLPGDRFRRQPSTASSRMVIIAEGHPNRILIGRFSASREELRRGAGNSF